MGVGSDSTRGRIAAGEGTFHEICGPSFGIGAASRFRTESPDPARDQCRRRSGEAEEGTMIVGRPVGFVLAGFLLLSAVSPGWAASAMEELKRSIDRVLEILQDPVLAGPDKAVERRKAVRKVADEVFDFTEISRRSLARHWQGRSPRERAEFVKLFGDLLERSYFSRIEVYGGEKIQYLREEIESDLATVFTTIITKQGQEVPVSYRMHRSGGRWLVYDVVVEGVSLVSNYRSQFNRIIQTSSYAELVKRMKTKQEEFLVDPTKPKESARN
jgi:phospholipid transport system substrate-binding protein